MRKILFVTLVGIFLTGNVLAGQTKRLDLTTSLAAESTLMVDVGVGQLDVRRHGGDELIVDVLVRAKNHNGGWDDEDIDLSDVSMTIDRSGDRLSLEVPFDNTDQEWEIKVPYHIHLKLDMGVGEVDVSDADRDVNVDVGVGEVDVSLAHDNYAVIDADSGVGSTDIRGFGAHKHSRSVVSETSRYKGDGEYRINVDVGVGDIDIRH